MTRLFYVGRPPVAEVGVRVRAYSGDAHPGRCPHAETACGSAGCRRSCRRAR